MQQLILYLLLVICFFSTTLKANSSKPSLAEALEKTSNQQVLSQEVAKVYVALCNNIMEPTFYQERDKAISAFDEELYQLSLFVPNENIKQNIQNVRKLWKEYKAIAEWSIKKDAAAKLLKQSTTLLQAIKLLHAAYLDYQKSQTAVEMSSDWITINEYMKQNNNQLILMQRIMLYYLSEKQGIDATNSGHKLDDAQNAFVRILNILEKAKITSETIQHKLKFIKSTWSGISKHLVFVNKDQSYVDDMLDRSKLISKTILEIRSIYKKLGGKLAISYAINASTAQSMLTQKIAKAYIASHNDHIAYKYKKEVLEHIDDFESKINAMSSSIPGEDAQRAINVVKTMWKNYKALVTDFSKKDEIRVIKVLEQCHVVMAACDRITHEVENYALSIPAYKALSEKDGEKVDPSMDITHQIKVSSILRINSQRVALYYIMRALELDTDISTNRLNGAVSDFTKRYKELKSSRLNSTAMIKLLESCDEEWNWITNACNENINDIDLMLKHSDMLSKKMMKLTNLYEHKMNDFFAQDLDKESPAASAVPVKH